jgi:hypothetical protein
MNTPSEPGSETRVLGAVARAEGALDIDLSVAAQRWFGDYELLERIGQGGMGVVYRARQHSLQRMVAVKLLPVESRESQEDVERFRREARSAARMQHPNIVEIYEFGTREGINFFSMRLVEGQSLAARVAASGPLEPRAAASLLRPLAEAIDYAHRLGVLHLDLKPANVLLTADGDPLVADFGLARLIEASEAGNDGEISGTPNYMAPEQALAETHPITASTDIYGLGAILYETLTGKPPFRGESAQSILEQVVASQPRAPRTTRRDIPPDLEAICLKCLEKAPADRYARARDLADDLGRFLEGRPVLALPLNLPRRALRWVRREPRLAAAMIASVLALVIGIAATSLQWRRAERALAVAKEQTALAKQRAARMEQLTFMLAATFPPAKDLDERHEQAQSAVRWLRSTLFQDDAAQGELVRALVRALSLTGNNAAVDDLLQVVHQVIGKDFRAETRQALSASKDPRHWLMSGLVGVTANDGDSARAEIRRASAALPNDARMQLLATALCNYEGCPAPESPSRLAAIDPDNLMAWVAQMGSPTVDAPRMRALIAQAARARHWNDAYGQLVKETAAAYRLGGVALPSPLRVPFETGVKAEDRDYAAYVMATYWLSSPSLGKLVAACDPGRVPLDAALRADCTHIATVLATSTGRVAPHSIGLNMLRRLTRGAPEQSALRELKRQDLWLFEQEGERGMTPAQTGESFVADLLAHGELEAERRRLNALGVARTPPQDWSPKNPRDLEVPATN